MTSGYRELPHPADLCLEVWGSSRAELYAQAAAGLYAALECSIEPCAEPVVAEVSLSSPDPETLLVDWLSELLYRSEAQGVIWQSLRMRKVTATSLSATIRGLCPGHPRREVKAVTYTGLRVVLDDTGRWWATVTFDV